MRIKLYCAAFDGRLHLEIQTCVGDMEKPCRWGDAIISDLSAVRFAVIEEKRKAHSRRQPTPSP